MESRERRKEDHEPPLCDAETLSAVIAILLPSEIRRVALAARLQLRRTSAPMSPADLATLMQAAYGMEHSVRKLIDAQSDRDVFCCLSSFAWRGSTKRYVPSSNPTDASVLRSYSLLFESLLVAQLRKGAAGVDATAAGNALLREFVPRPGKPIRASVPPSRAGAPSWLAMAEAVNAAAPGTVVLSLGPELVAIDQGAARELQNVWKHLRPLTEGRDPAEVAEHVIALADGASTLQTIPVAVRHVLLRHLINGGRLEDVYTVHGRPRIDDLLGVLQSEPPESWASNADVLRRAYFADEFGGVEELLLACVDRCLENRRAGE